MDSRLGPAARGRGHLLLERGQHIRDLLSDDRVRFHIKDVVVAILRALPDPSLSDWLKEMPCQPWMAGMRKVPIKIVD